MKKLILATVAIFALVGCGGGGGNNNTSLPSGSLDKTFATNGVKTDGGADDDYIYDLKCKADNYILTAGVIEKSSGEWDSVLSGYKDNGAPDDSFASNGKVYSSLSGNDEVIRLTTDSNGNIYLIGFSTHSNGDKEFMLAKFKPDGSIDSSFGSSGMVKEWVNGHNIRGSAIAFYNNYIVTGKVDDTTKQITIEKFDLNGNKDATFGVGIGGSKSKEINDITIDSSGNVYAVGYIENSNEDILLVKLKANGTLDTNFGSNGLKIFDKNNEDNKGMAIKLDSSNHIIVAGLSGDYMYLTRLDLDGNLDTTFGNNGAIVYSSAKSGAYDLILDSNEDILVTGGIAGANSGEYFMSIWKYDITGSAVISFGNNGLAKFDTGEHLNIGFAIDIDNNGKIVVGGSSKQSSNELQATIWRVNP